MTPGAVYGSAIGIVDGGLISEVTPESPAARAGVVAGDVIVSVEGTALRDVIDWQWETDGLTAGISLSHAGEEGRVCLRRDPGEPWGIAFADMLFDQVRTCENRCAFCFMSQLPHGLRRPLYVRDDDYRLSFLQGNFVTLTNLTQADVDRIIEQHLSPLNVSVHAVTPSVRTALVCARDDRALEVADQLLDAGIEMNAQIVLVPGVNDGDELDRTLRWLAQREGVISVGVVPLGFTRHQSRFSASYASPGAAAAIIDRIAPWREAFFADHGRFWVHAADELYLAAGIETPAADRYDGYPQFENGIGLVRDFTDAFVEGTSGKSAVVRPEPDRSRVVVSGTLFAPVLHALLNQAGLLGRAEVLPVENEFFGGNVSVAGLLTGADIVRALEGCDSSALYIMPDVILNADGVTLDDMTVEMMSAGSGCEMTVAKADARGLLSVML